MSDDALRQAFEKELGSDQLAEGPSRELEGRSYLWAFEPRDGEALAEGLALLADREASVLVVGAGSHLGLGRPPARAQALLSTRGLTGIDELDPDEGVLHARAGTPLASLRQAARVESWELPLDTPGPPGSLGGALATAWLGPRSQGWGAPREAVLGLEVTLSAGQRTRCGGRVVKNVTGFDLAKLYVGSLGSLGVIEGGWLRLRPRPTEVRVLGLRLPDEDPHAAALEASRVPCARAALVLDGAAASESFGPQAGGPTPVMAVELAGEPEANRRDQERLAAWGEVWPLEAEALDRGRDRAPDSRPNRLAVRAVLRPSRVPEWCRGLGALAARFRTLPALGIVDLSIPASEGDGRPGGATAFSTLRERARACGGHAWVSEAPPGLRRRLPGFDAGDASLRLMRELKRRYDPAGVLNPGRLAEGV